MTRSIRQRLANARNRLNQTLQHILNINQLRKQLPYLDNPSLTQKELKEELRVLNKIAAMQALLIRHYESMLVAESY